ncbi:MAG: indolepyruvate oxidoreductase subunit beta [Deltaproteobacteria bacterium]|nr:MAG: indolepyruvate oxidoreductase subunit beta [Deltaproteobacteria bacterium]
MRKDKTINLIITGVGGQGNILASQVIADVASDEGYYVIVGETYGLSQRGGSVMSHVRLSRDFECGPLIPSGMADIIIGFEPLETLRVAVQYCNKGTSVILNPRPNYPIGVLAGDFRYPALDRILETLQKIVGSVSVVEATELANEVGSSLVQNIVMVGCLAGSGLLPFSLKSFEKALKATFSGERLQLNRKAFNLGVKALKNSS